MLSILITIIHVIVCAVLIVVVLLQHGKSADIAATFGGMGSQTAFGPRGTATVFSRLTTWCAIIFMLTSMALTYMTSLRVHLQSWIGFRRQLRLRRNNRHFDFQQSRLRAARAFGSYSSLPSNVRHAHPGAAPA
jgi:preprotein translocase subunit SecG